MEEPRDYIAHHPSLAVFPSSPRVAVLTPSSQTRSHAGNGAVRVLLLALCPILC